MKKFVLFFAIVLSFCACKKDDIRIYRAYNLTEATIYFRFSDYGFSGGSGMSGTINPNSSVTVEIIDGKLSSKMSCSEGYSEAEITYKGKTYLETARNSQINNGMLNVLSYYEDNSVDYENYFRFDITEEYILRLPEITAE